MYNIFLHALITACAVCVAAIVLYFAEESRIGYGATSKLLHVYYTLGVVAFVAAIILLIGVIWTG